MRTQALRYAQSVVAAGAALAAAAVFGWQSADPAAFLLCALMGIAASTFKVRLPGLTGTITPAFVFLLLAVGRLSWQETVVIGIASALVQSLWRPRVRPSGLQVAFGAATIAISAALAHAAAHSLIAGPVAAAGSDELALRLAAAGIVLLAGNSLLTATVLCLIEDAPLGRVWRAIQLWAVPYYLGGGLLAAVWSPMPLTAAQIPLAVVALTGAYLVDCCARQMAERLAPPSPTRS